MAAGSLKKFLTADWCFAGVIVFFIVHGYSENQFLVPLTQLLLLLGGLLFAGCVLYLLFRRIFRNGRKATLFTAFLFAIVLFFGVVQDFLSQFRFLSVITRLTILVPLSILLIIAFFIWLKRTSLSFNRTIFFLDTLLLLYVVVDLGLITYRFISPPKEYDRHLAQHGLQVCDSCDKPSVYFILLDSYYGAEGLKASFDYDNSRFESFLKQKNFLVSQSTHSNYYYTIYSMASLLNMDYLPGIGAPVIRNHYGYNRATGEIRNNLVCRYFSSLGYRINNFSLFDVPGVPAGYHSGLLPDKIQLITHQTLYYRIKKYLPPFLVRIGWVKQLPREIEDEYIRNNEEMMAKTLAESRAENAGPTFTYLHLMMPHGPLVYDSAGSRTNVLLHWSTLSKDTLAKMFLQYQVYTNNRMKTFIEQLQSQTKGEAVIILMSDHGYQPAYEKEKKLAYYNLNAVYLPSRHYEGWYTGVSNVNQFRILFNTLFGQRLPLLKDSIVSQ